MLARAAVVLVATSVPEFAESHQWGLTAASYIPVSTGSEIAAGDLNGAPGPCAPYTYNLPNAVEIAWSHLACTHLSS